MNPKQEDGSDLRHSVAFRVTEQEWRLLQEMALEMKTTVPQLVKQILFKKMGWNSPGRSKRAYGQAANTNR